MILPTIKQVAPRRNELTPTGEFLTLKHAAPVSELCQDPLVLLHHSPNQEKLLAASCATTSARENTTSLPRIGNTASTSLTAGLPNR